MDYIEGGSTIEDFLQDYPSVGRMQVIQFLELAKEHLIECASKAAFPGLAVRTVNETGWRTSTDRALLLFAQERFDVFVTIDRKLEKQRVPSS